MDQGATGPVAEGERIAVMDVLRGFALLGIFLMNVEWFGRPLQHFAGGPPDTGGLDGLAGALVYVLVQGKFWVLFSLLFGMGFALMHQRAQAAGRPFVGIYLRRTLLLGLFGAAHIAFFWIGDVLLTYALGALLLLAFLKVRGPALWLSGLGFYLLLAGMMLLSGLVMGIAPPAVRADMTAQMAGFFAAGDAAAEVYRNGSFLEVTRLRIDEYLGFVVPNMTVFHVPMALGCFLIGAWLLRSGRLADIAANRGFFLKLALSGLLLGGAFLAASLSVGMRFDPVEEVGPANVALGLMALGNLPLSLAYLSIIALLCASAGGARLLGFLAPAGRMALTNYLGQSLVCSLVFYGYGLGVYDGMGRAAQVGFVFLVFALQVAFSHWWLARFRFGPLEWLWRAGTYLRWPPLRR